MRILMTGGSGFVGSNVREYFFKMGYDIYAPSSKELDCLDEQKVRECLKDGRYDVVLHFAVYGDGTDKSKDASKTLEYNLRIFLNFYRSAELYGKMIYTGSGAEYDKRFPIVSATEDEISRHTVPTDQYGLMKYCIGKLIEQSDNIYNLRLFGIFGKHEYWKTKFISNICCKSLMGLPLSIRQDCYFDYLWIDDFCRMLEMFLWLEKPRHHTYNAVRGFRIDLHTLADIVNEVAETPQPIIVCKNGFANEYTASNKRILEELPGMQFTNIRDAIHDLYGWYRDNKELINIGDLIYG